MMNSPFGAEFEAIFSASPYAPASPEASPGNGGLKKRRGEEVLSRKFFSRVIALFFRRARDVTWIVFSHKSILPLLLSFYKMINKFLGTPSAAVSENPPSSPLYVPISHMANFITAILTNQPGRVKMVADI
jgi:hypothetical protein